MSLVAWEMTSGTALEFFKRCMKQKAETEQARIEILIQLAEEGKIDRATTTNKSKEEYMKDKAKHFRVLSISRKNGQENQ